MRSSLSITKWYPAHTGTTDFLLLTGVQRLGCRKSFALATLDPESPEDSYLRFMIDTSYILIWFRVFSVKGFQPVEIKIAHTTVHCLEIVVERKEGP